MSFFNNSVIKVTRNVESSVSDIGTPIYTLSIIENNLNVTLQKFEAVGKNSGLIYNEMGQVDIPNYILTCSNFTNIKFNDILVIISSNLVSLEIGDKLRVIEKPYSGTLINHIQINLKAGVK